MFSVVIPLFNKELSIQNTIQSVLEQTYQEFEIIVIDDGSTDNSAKQVKEIPDSRIKLVQQRNQGVSAARNRGIKESKFDWIALLDGDDLWEPNHLEEILKMMHEFPDEKVYVTSFKYSNNQTMYRHNRPSPIFKIENYFREALKENLVWTSIVVVHKSCFTEISYFKEFLTRGEDLDLWTRLAKKYEIVKSTEITGIYRIDAENRTSLGKDLEKTHVYYINLSSIKDPYELYYHEKAIITRLLGYVKARNILNVYSLRKKHPEIKLKTYLSHTTTLVIKKILNNIS